MMKKLLFRIICSILLPFVLLTSGCGKPGTPIQPPVLPPTDTGKNPPPTPIKSDVQFWLTNPDKSALFQRQNVSLDFSANSNSNPIITVDTTQHYQSIDGFGFCLTGGSAYLIYHLPSDQRQALLQELFSTDSTYIGISYLRLSMGASDLSQQVFSYDDVPAGQTDTTLQYFSLGADTYNLIPLLQEILKINPNIQIIATPWSAPVWMKTNNSSVGGSLNPKYYGVYAKYFVKYIQEMKANGITISAITPQNEPLNPDNNPSMVMSDTAEDIFIKGYLGPAFQSAGLDTKIIIYDHNCDRPDYPMYILADPDASQYIDGSAFHLYAGSITALSQVHNAYPDKNLYFTEQYTGGPGNFGPDVDWAVQNLIIGATRNWSKNVLEWNLASDPNYEPHTPGGCSTCMGALTIGSSITRNESYYIIASASKFVRPGAVRINSNITGNLQNVAFQNTDGSKVLIVLNTGNANQNFNIQFNGEIVSTMLNAGSVGTYVWK